MAVFDGEARAGDLGPNPSRAEASWYKRCARTDQEQFGQFVAAVKTPSSENGLGRPSPANKLSGTRCCRRLCLPGRAHDRHRRHRRCVLGDDTSTCRCVLSSFGAGLPRKLWGDGPGLRLPAGRSQTEKAQGPPGTEHRRKRAGVFVCSPDNGTGDGSRQDSKSGSS